MRPTEIDRDGLSPEDEEKLNRSVDYRMFALNDAYGVGCLIGMGILTPRDALDEFGDPIGPMREQKYRGICNQRETNNG